MCIAGIVIEHPQLCDAIPAAERLSELGSRLTDPQDAAICHVGAATLRHLRELATDEETYSIDEHTRRVVLDALIHLRGLVESQLPHQPETWRRAQILLDNAAEELGR